MVVGDAPLGTLLVTDLIGLNDFQGVKRSYRFA